MKILWNVFTYFILWIHIFNEEQWNLTSIKMSETARFSNFFFQFGRELLFHEMAYFHISFYAMLSWYWLHCTYCLFVTENMICIIYFIEIYFSKTAIRFCYYNVSNITFSRIARDSLFFVCNEKLSDLATILWLKNV